MAHTFDTGGTSSTFVSANPITASATLGAGATVLVVGIGIGGGTARVKTSDPPTFNGVPLTDSGFGSVMYGTNPEANVEVWYMTDPPTGGAYQISVPNPSTSKSIRLIWASFKAGAGMTSVVDAVNTASAVATTCSCPITSSANGDAIFNMIGWGSNTAISSSQTVVASKDDGNFGFGAQYNLQTSAGALDPFWRQNSDDYQAITIAFKEGTPPKKVVADYGAFSLSGQAVTPKASRILSASNGSFTLSGQAITFSKPITPPAIVDTFNRANETPLTLGTTWQECNGKATHNLASNAIVGANWNPATAYSGSAGGAVRGYYDASGSIAVGAKVTKASGWTSVPHFEAFLRISTAPDGMWNSHYYRIKLLQGGSNWSIGFYRYDQGLDSSTLITQTTVSAHTDGDEYLFVSQADGTLLAYRNGIQIATTTDTTSGYYNIGGYVAIVAGYNGTTAPDLAILDDVRVGVMASAPSATYTLSAGYGSISLSGQAVSPKAGRTLIPANGSLTLSGQAVALSRGRVLSASNGSLSLSGQAVSPKAGRVLNPANGSLSLSGQAVTLTKGTPTGKTLGVDFGAFVLSGQSVTLKPGRSIAIANGSFALSGQVVTPKAGRILAPANGSFVLTGEAVTLKPGRAIASSNGSFVLSGQAVTLTKGAPSAKSITVDAGAFVLSGQVLTPKAGRIFNPSNASLALSGQSLALKPGRKVAPEMGSFILSGEAITLYWKGVGSREIPAGVGSFVVTGKDVVLFADLVRLREPGIYLNLYRKDEGGIGYKFARIRGAK